MMIGIGLTLVVFAMLLTYVCKLERKNSSLCDKVKMLQNDLAIADDQITRKSLQYETMKEGLINTQFILKQTKERNEKLSSEIISLTKKYAVSGGD